MRSLIARRKHVDLIQALAAFYDPNNPPLAMPWCCGERHCAAPTRIQRTSFFRWLDRQRKREVAVTRSPPGKTDPKTASVRGATYGADINRWTSSAPWTGNGEF
jgi:hypothetical protein